MKQNLQINTDTLAHNERLVIRERGNGQVEISKEYKLLYAGEGGYQTGTIFFLLFTTLVLFLAFASSVQDQSPEPIATASATETQVVP